MSVFALSKDTFTETVTVISGNSTINDATGKYYIGMGISTNDTTTVGSEELPTIPENLQVSTTHLNSNQLTMNGNALASKSLTAIFNKTNYNVPTNPRFTTFNKASYTSPLYTIIYEQAPSGSAETFVLQGGAEFSNLENTNGYQIKCYDSFSQTGLDLSSIDLDTDYYFVLIHSDDYLQHHFARIKEVTNFDVNGDSFEFEPKLGNQIDKDVKFKVFKGPSVSNSTRGCDILAISAGIGNDLKNNLVCSRPLFYFFDELLDKKGQLNHNTKYFMKFISDAGTGTITPNVTNTFVTAQSFSNKILDKSKFTMSVKLVDNLKELDYPAYLETASNVASSLDNEYDADPTSAIQNAIVPVDFTDYDECFPNARRDSDLDVVPASDVLFTGAKRYIHYDYSPTKSNKNNNTIDLVLEESIGKRGSYCEVKIIDNKRIMRKKISPFKRLRVRHRVFKENFNDWFALKATVKSRVGSTNEYTFSTSYDLSTLFNVGDEVKVNNTILIVDTIDSMISGTTGNEQDITFRAESRLETESIFASSGYVLSESDILYRRAWNTTDSTLLTNFEIIENRNENLYVKLISKDFGFLEATVTSSDKQKQLLTLSFTKSSQSTSISSLDYMFGSYYIEVEKFAGDIENISTYRDNGQTIMELFGRSDIRKLIGPKITRNALHSEDMIYSSISAFGRLEPVSGSEKIATVNTNSKTITCASNGLNAEPYALGGQLFLKHEEHGTFSYVGKIASLSGTDDIVLEDFPLTKSSTNNSYDYLYIIYANNVDYSFNKALSSNSSIDSASSLNGAANKGLYFNGGTKLITTTGADNTDLIRTNPEAVTNANSIGYYLTNTKNLKSDSIFQGRLSDVNNVKENFQTINSLLDFSIISQKQEDGNTIIELAPYLPLTLGRVDINYGNVRDTTFNATNFGTVNSSFTDYNLIFASVIGSGSENLLSSLSNPRKYHGKPLYAGGVFMGLIAEITHPSSTANTGVDDYVAIYLDRIIETAPTAGQSIQIIEGTANYGETTKLTHELNLLNAGHLHGGKIISPLHSVVSSDDYPMVLNYVLYYSTEGHSITYAEKFGSPYYRVFNLEKGNYNATTTRRFQFDNYGNDAKGGFNPNYYANNLSEIQYYATAYRYNGGYTVISGTYDSRITGVGKTGYSPSSGNKYNHLLNESRGFLPVSGSRFFDTSVHKGSGTYDPVTFSRSGASNLDNANPYSIKRIDMFDPKVARMFLFSNSDITPYSSKRLDSLMNQSRDISKYNIMTISEPSPTTSSDTKESRILGKTTSLNFVDKSYSMGNIISSDKTLSNLSRFSIMRLTEVCFDWALNQIDAENVPKKSEVISEFKYTATLPVSLSSYFSGGTGRYTSVSNTHIEGTADMSALVSADDLIVDSEGRFICKVTALQTNGSGTANARIYAAGGTFKTDGSNYYGGTLFVVKTSGAYTTDVTGHGSEDTFVNFDKSIHMLRTAIVNDTGSGHYGEDPSAWYSKYGETLDNSSNSSRETNTYLPIAVEADSILGDEDNAVTLTNHPSKIFKILDELKDVQDSVAPAGSESIFAGMMPLVLDRFNIENADDGAKASKGTVAGVVRSMSAMQFDAGSNDTTIFGVSLHNDFAQFEDVEGTARTYSEDADGVMLAYKPKLYIDTSQTPDTLVGGASMSSVGNTAQYVYTIVVDTDITDIEFFQNGGNQAFNKINRTALKLINDLTGCYLVSESVKYYDDRNTLSSSPPIVSGGDKVIDTISINNGTPNHFAYVISHEIDVTNSTETHILTLDAELDSSTARGHFYRIMQPNHVCFYDYSPKNIRLNTLSSEYTKKPNEEECYAGDINDYMLYNKAGPRQFNDTNKKNNAGGQEAALSMYILIDPDVQSGSPHLTIRDHNYFSSILPSEKIMYVSDGEKGFKTTVKYLDNDDAIGHYLELSDIEKQIGVVSVTEPFTVKVDGLVDSGQRAIIGAGVTICSEIETLASDLLEENEIDVTTSSTVEYPVFIAPHFKNVDLFSAINFLLSKKDKILYYDNKFYIKDKNDSYFDSGVFINDVDGVELYEYEKTENLFDLYNEIIVYGGGYKSIRRDIRSINKIGKKTLIEYDGQLITQEEVDKRSYELLKIHMDNNLKLKVIIGHTGASQLKAGDIVELEIRRENLPRQKYLIIQLKHLLTGNIELELGRYSKGLEDRFSEIEVEQSKLNTQVLDDNLTQSNVLFTFLDEMKIKPIRLIVKERASSGGSTLGFGTTLNTNTRPLGFSGGSGVTHTTLVEEDF
jgi:hypothetical protein